MLALMVDFSKFRIPRQRYIYKYKCDRCNQTVEYTVEMQDKMRRHTESFTTFRPIVCHGWLELLEKREDKSE